MPEQVSIKLAVFALIIVAISVKVAYADNCPIFGKNQTSSLTRSTKERQYFNFDSPLQCRGKLTGWNFCFYKNDLEGLRSRISAVFTVFRRNSQSNDYVSVTRKEMVFNNNFIANSLQFVCMKEELRPENSIEVETNDVIGACIKRDDFQTSPLYVIGTSNDTSLSTHILDQESTRYCKQNNFYFGNIKKEDNSVMHLFADIAVVETCIVGRRSPPSFPLTEELTGTYLNTQYPVTCGNYITKWHYCYYTEAATPRSTLSMTVAVWSLDEDTNTYIVSPSSIRNITTQHAQQTLAKIFCVEESLDENEYIAVSPGDVIGVILPSRNVIPIVSFNESHSHKYVLKDTNTVYPLNHSQSDLIRHDGTELHFYATLEIGSKESTVTDSMNDNTAEYSSTFTITSAEMAKKVATSVSDLFYNDSVTSEAIIQEMIMSGKIVWAIVGSVALVIAITLLVVIVVVVLLIRNKNNSKIQRGIDNGIYCARESDDENIAAGNYERMTDLAKCSNLRRMNVYSTVMDTRVYTNDSENEIYSSLINNTCIYQNELEKIKQGQQPDWQENIYCDPADNEDDIYFFLKERKIVNIPGERVIIGRVLGSGQFGTVHQGRWKANERETIDVALKSLNTDASKPDRVKFLQEAAIMAQFRHPNVAALCGVTEKDGTTMIVVELLPNGDLRQHLHTLKPDPGQLVPASTPNRLLHFSQQICLGMNYLSTTGFVHRDLAARNVLLSSGLVCKIADFGMSRDLNEGDYYTSSGGLIPVKWTAPEALHYKKYSTASDVWSYGCVLYEIWSLGHKPFEEMKNDKVLRLIDSGKRMAPPPGCPKRMYELMIICWAPNPRERPDFREVLLSMLESESLVLYIPPEVTDTHPQAATLGASRKAGYQMYTDLQKIYM